MFRVFTINILRAVVDKYKTNGGLDVRKSIRDVIVAGHITGRPSTLIIMRVYFLLMFFSSPVRNRLIVGGEYSERKHFLANNSFHRGARILYRYTLL